MSAPLLTLPKFSVYYGPVQAIHGIELHVGEGEIVTVIGPNGAGKTTLLDMALGFSPPSDGTVSVFGSDPVAAVRQGRVGAVLQTGGLLEDLSVRETVAMVAGCHRRHIGVPAALERAGLTGLAGRRVPVSFAAVPAALGATVLTLLVLPALYVRFGKAKASFPSAPRGHVVAWADPRTP